MVASGGANGAGHGSSSSAVLSAAAAAAVATCVLNVPASSFASASASSAPSRPALVANHPTFGIRQQPSPGAGATSSTCTAFGLKSTVEALRGGGDASPEESSGGGAQHGHDASVDGSSVRGGATPVKKRKKKRSKKKTRKPTGTESVEGASDQQQEQESFSSPAQNTEEGAATATHQTASDKNAAEADDAEQRKESSSSKSKHHRSHSKHHSRSHSSKKKSCAQQDAIIQNILDAADHYEVLDVTKSATETEIKKAYRRRAVRTHPDKVPDGDRTAFDKVAKAYEVLSDENKRALYDRFGDAGVETGGNPNPGFGGFGGFGGDMFGAAGGSAEEVLRKFGFFGSGPGGPRPFQPRNQNKKYQMECTLEDLYNGLTRTVTIAQPSSSPGTMRRKNVEVTVPRGMASGQTIRLSGEIDHVPGAAPADLIFVVAQRRHPIFSRRGHDLAMEVTLSLREALCGFCRSFTHLDGRTVVIGPPRVRVSEKVDTSPANVVDNVDTNNTQVVEEKHREAPVLIRTGDVHVLKGEGMPKPAGQRSGARGRYGDLYVQYKVEMPSATSGAGENLSTEERAELDRLLRKLEGGEEADFSTPAENSGLDNDNDNDEIDAEGNRVRYMKRASPSEFGRASGVFEQQSNHGEEHLHNDDEDEQSRFFSAFGGGAGQSGFHYYSSTSNSPGGECQQM